MTKNLKWIIGCQGLGSEMGGRRVWLQRDNKGDLCDDGIVQHLHYHGRYTNRRD